uniref:Uncharacterized protein n=1 Tax=Glossina austeni TaxID=7395 RepID=A0A1A9UYN5_GLOAU
MKHTRMNRNSWGPEWYYRLYWNGTMLKCLLSCQLTIILLLRRPYIRSRQRYGPKWGHFKREPSSLKFGYPKMTTSEKIFLSSMFYPLFAIASQHSPKPSHALSYEPIPWVLDQKRSRRIRHGLGRNKWTSVSDPDELISPTVPNEAWAYVKHLRKRDKFKNVNIGSSDIKNSGRICKSQLLSSRPNKLDEGNSSNESKELLFKFKYCKLGKAYVSISPPTLLMPQPCNSKCVSESLVNISELSSSLKNSNWLPFKLKCSKLMVLIFRERITREENPPIYCVTNRELQWVSHQNRDFRLIPDEHNSPRDYPKSMYIYIALGKCSTSPEMCDYIHGYGTFAENQSPIVSIRAVLKRGRYRLKVERDLGHTDVHDVFNCESFSLRLVSLCLQ